MSVSLFRWSWSLQTWNFIKKETPKQLSSGKFFEGHNIFFVDHLLPWETSVKEVPFRRVTLLKIELFDQYHQEFWQKMLNSYSPTLSYSSLVKFVSHQYYVLLTRTFCREKSKGSISQSLPYCFEVLI